LLALIAEYQRNALLLCCRNREVTMSIHLHPPVYCEKCSDFALAVLDGAPLCESCLVEQVHLKDESRSFSRIEPLYFKNYNNAKNKFQSSFVKTTTIPKIVEYSGYSQSF
jgi:hypothetical protein